MGDNILKDEIKLIEGQMKLKLEEIRTTFKQSGDRGAIVEKAYREFLQKYLPKKMSVGHGEIIDSRGQRSKQTDVVIINEDHPFTFTPEFPGFFFIEGVSAVGEVKTSLTSGELKSALMNSYQFKQLEIQPGHGSIIVANSSDIKRFYKWPPFFLFAFESQLTLSHIQKEIMLFETENSVEANRLVDGVFVLDKGWVINFGDGEGSFKYLLSKDNTSIKGWANVNSDAVLFDLLAWLSIVMPKLVRFEPILPRYMIRKI